MKKNEVFTFTAPNGVDVTAVVIDCLDISNHEQTMEQESWVNRYLCYAQNRLFYYNEWTQVEKVIDNDFVPANDEENDYYYALMYHSHEVKTTGSSQEILVEYCILPEYDKILEAEQQKFDDDCYEALSSIGDIDF